MGFWTVHGVVGGFFYIVFLFLFPRLTVFATVTISALVGSTIASVGITGSPAWMATTTLVLIAWIALIPLPRVIIAAIALYLYSETNPVLCVFACILGWINGMTVAYIASRGFNEFLKKQPESGLSYLDITRLAMTHLIWEKFGLRALFEKMLAERGAKKAVPEENGPDVVHIRDGKTDSPVINLREVRENYRKALNGRS
jgi:hypothetical protein